MRCLRELSLDSEDPLSIGIRLFESNACALVEDSLGLKTLVLVIVVESHAVPKRLDLALTEGIEDLLTRRAFIFSRETTQMG